MIYDGDNFIYTVDENGLLQLVKHETSLSNIDNTKILGAYAVVIKKDGSKHLKVMTIDMIRKAWGQGATRGNSGAHVNFTDQMAKKTIIGRACKVALDSTSDGEEEDTMVPPTAEQERDIANGTSEEPIRKAHHDDFEDGAEYEDVTGSEEVQEAQPEAAPAQPKAAPGKKVRECPI